MAYSKTFKAVLASPFAIWLILAKTDFSICKFKLPSPLSLLVRAFSKIVSICCSVNCFKTKTLHLESKALLTSKLGFSVVAPIKIIVPFSTCGNKASCWALFHLWISSINKIVFLPCQSSPWALLITSLKSFKPLVTAENLIKSALVCLAIIFAKVVLPLPGGPQNIIEGKWSWLIAKRNILPSPIISS